MGLGQGLDSLRSRIEALGLDFSTIKHHQKLIHGAIARSVKPQLVPVDTCRKDNRGIVSDFAEHKIRQFRFATTWPEVVAFVPAAGAGSRYAAALSELGLALEKGAGPELAVVLAKLRAAGAAKWCLPVAIKDFISGNHVASEISRGKCEQLLSELSLPKGLMPCVSEGLSFLNLKDIEHESLESLAGQVFVVPPGRREAFAAELERGRKQHKCNKKTAFIEQGPKLSTIRWRPDSSPWLDGEGNPSLVPAGHGALRDLFFEVNASFPTARAMFIRNIDNVAGIGEPVRQATALFISVYQEALSILTELRRSLQVGKVPAAGSLAIELWRVLRGTSEDFVGPTEGEASLRKVQIELFHTPSAKNCDLKALEALYQRPLNILGMVPNLGADVGGTPCFLENNGETIKVCVEAAHVSESDVKTFFADPRKATHFNPVFVCAEIPSVRKNDLAVDDFWLLSSKTFKGETVYYVETVLYELLGNSRLANCIFVEVPRLVFNPHKTISDAEKHSLAKWLGR